LPIPGALIVMKKVYSHENLALLHTAKGLLEINGISCFVKNEYHASGGHVGFGSIPIELWVQDDADAETAVSLLERELSNSSDRPMWTCSKCNEENHGSFETCWNCQRENTDTE
jgi:hypothetical protein